MTATVCDAKLPETKRKLLDASMQLMLRQGFTATTVDQICAEAGLTKGSFFHYFKSKEEIGEATLDYFSCGQRDTIARAGFHQIEDPLERFHGMLEFFGRMVQSPEFPKACLVGNLTQELAHTHPQIRCHCEESFTGWVNDVAEMLTAAKKAHPPATDFDPQSVANMALSLMQGSILVAKARQDPAVILHNIEHCRAYVDGLFGTDRH